MLSKPLMNGFPLMLPDATLPVPGSLASVLACLAPLFTAPSFRTFTMLACGVPRADRETHGVRDAGRRGPVPDLAA